MTNENATKIVINAEEIKCEDIKPGELFSARGTDYWDGIPHLGSLGESVYIRMPTPVPPNDVGRLTFRITIEGPAMTAQPATCTECRVGGVEDNGHPYHIILCPKHAQTEATGEELQKVLRHHRTLVGEHLELREERDVLVEALKFIADALKAKREFPESLDGRRTNVPGTGAWRRVSKELEQHARAAIATTKERT